MADDGNIPSQFAIIHANDILKNYYTKDTVNEKINKYFPPTPIGGKIFYDAGDNGATYTFYDSNGNIIKDTSISGLQNAVSYRVGGTPTKDRFYVVYPSILNDGKYVYWGFYRNADISQTGGNIVNTGAALGKTGKTNTRDILDYISIYASNEVASDNKPNSDISQASPNGYNLYKNCGTKYDYLWDIIKDTNRCSLGGHNDWFVPSSGEMYRIADSNVVSDITGPTNLLWSSSSSENTFQTLYWYWSMHGMEDGLRNSAYSCIVCRAF